MTGITQVKAQPFNELYVPLGATKLILADKNKCKVKVEVTTRMSQRGKKYYTATFSNEDNDSLIVANVYARMIKDEYYLLIESFKQQMAKNTVDEMALDQIDALLFG